MSDDAWFRLNAATFHWGERCILDKVTFALGSPSLAWLSGPSGSGKTTFLRIVAGHYALDAGTCEVLGSTIRSPGVDRPFVFQDHKLFPWKTVFENVASGLRFLKRDNHEIKHRVEDLLEKAGLREFRNNWPHQLSGGMQQRVGILRSLIVEPRCLIIDEPFSALDEDTARQMWGLIQQYLMDSSAVCLVSSHNLRHVRQGNGHVLMFSGDGSIRVIDPSQAFRAGTIAA